MERSHGNVRSCPLVSFSHRSRSPAQKSVISGCVTTREPDVSTLNVLLGKYMSCSSVMNVSGTSLVLNSCSSSHLHYAPLTLYPREVLYFTTSNRTRAAIALPKARVPSFLTLVLWLSWCEELPNSTLSPGSCIPRVAQQGSR